MDAELKVTKISEGTVIDHLPPGTALSILEILGLENSTTVVIAMNVESNKKTKKDIVKIENRILSKSETDKISLIAPHASINIIKNQEVQYKGHVRMPETLVDLVRCPNKKCITNFEESKTEFNRTGQKYKCIFCERRFNIEEFKLC